MTAPDWKAPLFSYAQTQPLPLRAIHLIEQSESFDDLVERLWKAPYADLKEVLALTVCAAAFWRERRKVS